MTGMAAAASMTGAAAVIGTMSQQQAIRLRQASNKPFVCNEAMSCHRSHPLIQASMALYWSRSCAMSLADALLLQTKLTTCIFM
jgi:hypothetical protein